MHEGDSNKCSLSALLQAKNKNPAFAGLICFGVAVILILASWAERRGSKLGLDLVFCRNWNGQYFQDIGWDFLDFGWILSRFRFALLPFCVDNVKIDLACKT